MVVAVAISLFAGAALAKPDGTSTMPSKRPADYEVGKRLWAQSCWQCHGTSGKGDGPAAAALPGGVPSLEGKMRAEDIPRMVAVVQAGKGRMPAYSEDIDEHDTRRTLIYIKDVLEGRKPPPAEKDAGDEDASEGQ
ncbi:MAG: cytochrome c [Pseudomonadota bacterium]|nr:cytochrome c [Pseudomonadota bacterium]